MTTWTTFETIDESQNWDEFYIDRLGVHQYRQDDRTRFVFTKGGGCYWNARDLEAEDDQTEECHASMRECIKWLSARVLYGA